MKQRIIPRVEQYLRLYYLLIENLLYIFQKGILMNEKILIIDDEDLFREDLALILSQEGYEGLVAATGEEGLTLIEKHMPQIVLCDINLPGMDGLEVLNKSLAISPDTSVIMITAYGTLESSLTAFRKGAADYITKPLVIEDVIQKVERLIKYKRLHQEVKFLRREVSPETHGIVGVWQSDSMKEILELIGKVAPTKSTVLLTGESGTGKELVASTIHALSFGADMDLKANEVHFAAVNCAGIPAELLESELFGHVRGAFTGATKDHVGYFELAGEGTIMLDELADMPLSLQSKLLRVLEQKEFSRVGSTKLLPLRARIISATNKDLRSLVKSGEFREDLFFRLAVFEIKIPPLREHRSDIPFLVDGFIKKFNQEMKRKCLGFDSGAMRKMIEFPWAGNIRELRNVIERAMILCHGDQITEIDLPAEIRNIENTPDFPVNLRAATKVFEKSHIEHTLAACDGNKEETAYKLGVNPSTLYRKMTDLGL